MQMTGPSSMVYQINARVAIVLVVRNPTCLFCRIKPSCCFLVVGKIQSVLSICANQDKFVSADDRSGNFLVSLTSNIFVCLPRRNANGSTDSAIAAHATVDIAGRLAN
jgi:hypothetical protein